MQIEEYIRRFNNFVFFSPHLDDAVLSCGSLLLLLKKLRKQVTVVTIFTKVTSPPYSQQAEEFLDACGYDKAKELFLDRIKEDSKAMEYLGAKYIYWDFIDAAWRKKENNGFVYKNSREQFSGRVAKSDLPLLDDLRLKIEKFINRHKRHKPPTFYLGPLGIGGHADHLLVRDTLMQLKIPKLFWEDYPYNNIWTNKMRFLEILKYKLLFEEKWSEEKTQMIKMYETQMLIIFPENIIPKRKEKYYTSNRG